MSVGPSQMLKEAGIKSVTSAPAEEIAPGPLPTTGDTAVRSESVQVTRPSPGAGSPFPLGVGNRPTKGVGNRLKGS